METSPNDPAIDHRPLIDLLLPEADELLALLRGERRLRGMQIVASALPPRSWLDQTRYVCGTTERGYRWSVPYLIALREQRLIVGSIGGKGIVEAESEVEIGYNVAPFYRNRGLATAAIHRLAQLARREGITLLAHTVPENTASRTALERAGFSYDESLRLSTDLVLERWSKSPD